jgi:TonB family protein
MHILLIAFLFAIPQTPAPQSTGTPDAPPWPPAGVQTPGKNGVTPPRLEVEIKPDYTRAAMRARIQGRVVVECVVDTDGSVRTTRILRSLDREFGLDEAAIAALKQWRFSPGMKDGVAVPVVVSVEIGFSLKGMPVLTWPAVFVKGNTALEEEPWAAEVIDASDLQIRLAYPAGWEIHKGGPPTRLLAAHSRDAARFVEIGRPRPSPRVLEEPLSVAQLEQSVDMLKLRSASRANTQIVDVGQFRASNRLWIWHEVRVPSFDPSSPPVDMSVAPNGKFGSARIWAFTTTARSQMIMVFCTLLYRSGMTDAEMQEQARQAGGEFAAIMERISISAR